MPCNSTHSWLPARKGLDVGKEVGWKCWGMEDLGASDWEEAMLIPCLLCYQSLENFSKQRMSLFVNNSLEAEYSPVPVTSSVPSLSPTIVSKEFPTTSCCHCLSLYSQNNGSFFLTPFFAVGNYTQASSQILLSKNYYFSETEIHTGSQYKWWGLQTNTFSALRNSLQPEVQTKQRTNGSILKMTWKNRWGFRRRQKLETPGVVYEYMSIILSFLDKNL